MQATVSLRRFTGRKDRSPRVLSGQLGIVVRERGGRSVRVMSLSDKSATPPTLAELWEPCILSWVDHMVSLQGYEDNYGQWPVQVWQCELARPGAKSGAGYGVASIG
jgi:hypothetical protein